MEYRGHHLYQQVSMSKVMNAMELTQREEFDEIDAEDIPDP